MTIRVEVDPNEITTGDMIDAQNLNDKDLQQAIEFMSRFVIDESGARMPKAEAMAALRAIPYVKLGIYSDQLAASFRAMRESAVPLVTGKRSTRSARRTRQPQPSPNGAAS